MSKYPHLEQRLAFSRIFNKNAKLPESELEIMDAFEGLVGELSPENLACDGEASRGQIAMKKRNIKGAWAELEKMLGRKVSEGEVEDRIVRRYQNG